MPIIGEGTQNAATRKAESAYYKGQNTIKVENTAYPFREADYYVHIYSVSKRELLTTHALVGNIIIQACAPDQRYRRIGIPLPQPFPQPVEDVLNLGRDPYDYHSAKRIAQDIVDPSNHTLNQDMKDADKVQQFSMIHNGVNFAKHGVFWSLNDPPTEEELKKAEARRDTFYRYCIETFDGLYASDPGKAWETVEKGGQFDKKDVILALDYFGEERPYHKKLINQYACPNCGTRIPQGVAFHRDADGDLCVIDWKRTVAAGKRKKDDVPDEHVWWDKKVKA